MDRSHIGKALIAARKLEGLDQQTLADLSQVSVRTLSDLERGAGNPTLASLLKVTETLGLKVSIK